MALQRITSAFKKGIPYNYVVGAPDSKTPIPFDVKLSLDKEFQKTILKSAFIFSGGILTGMALNAVLQGALKMSRNR